MLLYAAFMLRHAFDAYAIFAAMLMLPFSLP